MIERSPKQFMRVLFLLAFLLFTATALPHLPTNGGHQFEGALNLGLQIRGLQDEMDQEPSPNEEFYFEQKLDHFDPENHKTWKQRFLVNTSFYQQGGPVFLMLGGEGKVSSKCASGHFVFSQWAEKFGALVICVEHRYYGKSVPTPDTSLQNLKYLTSQQALADFANFRVGIASKYGAEHAKWIAFGGSYSGMLAAWQRMKYPHLFAGAVASSAPVWAKTDYHEYLEVVTRSIGPKCADRLRQATQRIEPMLNTQSGRRALEKIFNACETMEEYIDTVEFVSDINDPICGTVQYNHDNAGHRPFEIEGMCKIIESGPDPLMAWAHLTAVYANHSGSSCVGSRYMSSIRKLHDISPTSPSLASRSWTYQYCHEFGYFQYVKKGAGTPFSPRLDMNYFYKTCRDVFQNGPIEPDTHWTNLYFGSKHPVGTNVFWPNGDVDPWHALGVLRTPAESMPARVMHGTAHCADMYAPSPKDLDVLTEVRREIEVEIAKWVVHED
eukprot:gnl/Trimastix_PCT/751.p1 GENE.gnl/Trimastix_PCT/751~~gnl/Trimastix_PCT/751.p1  ORF type:complete len:507 (+),score=175.33 gnl/Trimastix_PCT/751:32-1522(+)